MEHKDSAILNNLKFLRQEAPKIEDQIISNLSEVFKDEEINESVQAISGLNDLLLSSIEISSDVSNKITLLQSNLMSYISQKGYFDKILSEILSEIVEEDRKKQIENEVAIIWKIENKKLQPKDFRGLVFFVFHEMMKNFGDAVATREKLENIREGK